MTSLRGRAQRVRWGFRREVRVNRLGFDFVLDLRDNVQRHLYRTGSYEPEITALLAAALPDDGTYIDVGAHIGIHALPVARAKPQARVVAFEPTPDSANRLRYAARQLPNVELVESALGATRGTVRLRADPDFDRHDAAVRSVAGPGEIVGEFPIETLDRWATMNALHRLDVIKLDVEGHELEALKGARQTLTALRPSLVVVEIQDHLLARSGVRPGAIEELLAELGYRSRGTMDRNTLFDDSAQRGRFARPSMTEAERH